MTTPVACVRRVEEAASERGDDARDWYDDIRAGIERGEDAAE